MDYGIKFQFGRWKLHRRFRRTFPVWWGWSKEVINRSTRVGCSPYRQSLLRAYRMAASACPWGHKRSGDHSYTLYYVVLCIGYNIIIIMKILAGNVLRREPYSNSVQLLVNIMCSNFYLCSLSPSIFFLCLVFCSFHRGLSFWSIMITIRPRCFFPLFI